MELLFVFRMLAVVAIGLLIVVQLVSFEEIEKAIARGLLVLGLAFVVFWIVKAFVLPILVCALLSLKKATLGALLVLLILLGIAALLHTAFTRAFGQHSVRTSHREEL